MPLHTLKRSKQFGASQVRELLNRGLDDLRSNQHDYWMNTAFLAGEQWIYLNEQTRTLAEVPRDPERVRTQINRLRPASRTVLSKLVSRELDFEVQPSGADDATIRGARTAEAILAAVRRDHDWEGVREDAYWSAWKGGMSAVCIDWDPSAGRPAGMGPSGTTLNTGDSVETALSVVEFVVEPGVRNAETARWWIKAVALPPEQVQATFPDQFPEPPAADATAGTTPLQQKLLSLHQGRDSSSRVGLTLVLTYYERPNPLSPEGRVLTVVGEKVVEEKPWYFPWKDRLNLVIQKETREDGSWKGTTILSSARPVQTALNQSWSSIIEHMKEAGNARLYVPQSMIDMIEEMTDLPGEFVPYPDASTPPGYVSPPSMPDWWIRQPEMLAMEIDDILGVHEASRGEAPKNIESGLGLSILIEQDATPIGRMTKEGAGCWGRLASMLLKLYEKFVKESRSSVIRTPGQPPRTTKWTGKDLKGQTEAIVPLDAVMPRSRAAQQQFAKDALQMGVIKTFAQYVKLADVPGHSDMLEAVSPDIAKARRENHTMSLGQPAVPEKFDEHTEHIQEHLSFMKSEEWDLMDDEARQIFRDHNLAHENLDAEKLGRQMSKAQVSPVLASAADATGAPVLPIPDAAAAAAPQITPPPPEAGQLAAGPDGGATDAALGEVDEALASGETF